MKKKIAVIGLKGLPAYGGAASVGENIIDQLKDKFDFTVYSVSSHTNCKTGNYRGYYQIVFKKIRNKKLNTLLYYIKATIHILLFSRYDLIHLHHRDAGFIIPFLKIRYRVFLTTHSLGTVFDKWKRFQLYFTIQEKYFIKHADCISSVSKNETIYLKERYNIHSTYIPNGIKSNDIVRKNNFSNIEDEAYLFFGAGRIIRDKGLDILLRAMSSLKLTLKLVVAGDLNQIKTYKEEILILSEDLNLEYVGLIKNKDLLNNYIMGCQLFVYPSKKEAMSMMLLEGASLKVPIICSDIVENTDIFTDEEVLFFKANDYQDLAEKLQWALLNLDIMKEKSKLAYSKLQNEYLWSDIAIKYEDIYNSLSK